MEKIIVIELGIIATIATSLCLLAAYKAFSRYIRRKRNTSFYNSLPDRDDLTEFALAYYYMWQLTNATEKNMPKIVEHSRLHIDRAVTDFAPHIKKIWESEGNYEVISKIDELMAKKGYQIILPDDQAC
ncbi:MAG: hypothetical protein N4A71_10960 [Carboxylicivirga sp.]|jgi:hypothetical protein|nr:hypothetical protein [Carboxylicivirga sp.]